MTITDFSKLPFTDQVKHLYELADKYNILHAKLVFKTILNGIQAVGYSSTYYQRLLLKTLNSMLQPVSEKYGANSNEYIELSAMYGIMMEKYKQLIIINNSFYGSK